MTTATLWTRRRWLSAAALLSLGASARAFAQGFPSRTIRVVVPWAPGGLVDS